MSEQEKPVPERFFICWSERLGYECESLYPTKSESIQVAVKRENRRSVLYGDGEPANWVKMKEKGWRCLKVNVSPVEAPK